jgi:hypothetical protein
MGRRSGTPMGRLLLPKTSGGSTVRLPRKRSAGDAIHTNRARLQSLGRAARQVYDRHAARRQAEALRRATTERIII